MGFFNFSGTSGKSALTLPVLTEVIAQYFAVDNTLASKWCKEDAGNFVVTLPFAAKGCADEINSIIEEAGYKADVNIAVNIKPMRAVKARTSKIKNIIAVASGKGGVGKSATSVNLAFALMQEGAKVGVLDADIYGPSIPIMLGNTDDHPTSSDGKHMHPLNIAGVEANSIGYVVPADNATVWRGPMASRALQQLLDETLWSELDYLIVDMPPGTGDIQLTLSQSVPVTGAVVVTTPQDLALADAVKGIAMFNKVNVPVLGLVENMSFYECRKCGHQEHIFARGGEGSGASGLADRYDTDVLGSLPLDIRIREHADGGKPLLLAEPDSPLSQRYRQIARNLSMKLALEGTEDSSIPVSMVEKH